MEKTKQILVWILTCSAILFGIAGFIVPPTGVVDSSVLWLVAQFQVFAASILGIDLQKVKLMKK